MTPTPHTYSLAPDAGLVAAYADSPGLAVAEIAGRDSAAAVIATARDEGSGIRVIVPTAVVTGTEYGDPGSPRRTVDYLVRMLPGVEFAPLVWVGEPRMWAALNGRFAREVAGRFAISSPCLACHLYMHLCRIPLARALGGVPVIAGERETHDGRVKLSQTARSIDICIEALAVAGVELLEPLRHASGAEVAALVGDGWDAGPGTGLLECVHSGNYLATDGSHAFDESAYLAYAEGFLRPAALALAGTLASMGPGEELPHPDYVGIVRDLLGEGA